MSRAAAYKDYGYASAQPWHMHWLLLPQVVHPAGEPGRGTPVLDVGCGNGAICGAFLTETGFKNLRFRGIGRFPGLWMSRAASGQRPSSQ